MNSETTQSVVIKSLVWKLLERFSTQGISFIVTILLAMLLSAEEYGTIALVSVFVALGNVIVDGGFSTALVQKKNADNLDFSTIFFASIAIALLLYLGLFFAAPYISTFYDQPILTPILRVLSLNLLLGAINAVQLAYMQRTMQFKKTFYSSFAGSFMSGLIGVTMAYLGFGVWALVAQTLSSQFFITLVMWIVLRWRPSFAFSWSRFKGLFNFGWKIFAINFIISIFLNIRSLIIGKLYTREMLGFFDRGQQFPKLLMTNVNGAIQSVMLPVYSQKQDDRTRLKAMLKRSIKTSSIVIFPIMMMLIAIAEPLIQAILPARWLPAVPFIQIFSLALMFMPIQSLNMEATKSMGESGTLLKIELLKKVFECGILFATMYISVYAIAWGVVIYNIICMYINLFPNRRLLDYGFREQVMNILPELLISVVMGMIVYPISFLSINVWIVLSLQVIVGIAVYAFLCKFFQLESFEYLLEMSSKYIKHKL